MYHKIILFYNEHLLNISDIELYQNKHLKHTGYLFEYSRKASVIKPD